MANNNYYNDPNPYNYQQQQSSAPYGATPQYGQYGGPPPQQWQQPGFDQNGQYAQYAQPQQQHWQQPPYQQGQPSDQHASFQQQSWQQGPPPQGYVRSQNTFQGQGQPPQHDPLHRPGQDRGFMGNAIGGALLGGAIHKVKKRHDDGHSSSSNDSEDDDKKKKNKFGKHNKPHHAVAGHPLAGLVDPTGATVVLRVNNTSEKRDDLVPLHDPHAPSAYVVYYHTGEFNGQVCRGPLLNPDVADQKAIGSWTVHTFRSEKLKFEFPETKIRNTKEKRKWGFNPDKDMWGSDVGFLDGHDMNWTFINESSSEVARFTLKCVDTTDSEKRVACQVVMTDYDNGRIEIPLRLISNHEQLDEIVTIAMAVMDDYRDDLVD